MSTHSRHTAHPGWIATNPGVRRHSWSDGYVVDTSYTDNIVVDLCPASLSFVATLQGQPPLDLTRPMTWLDIGSGNGLCATAVAAGNPNVEVWGIDYNPAHVERSRSLAERAELSNCHFAEASFEELATNPHIGPSEVDVVVVNGVYSWISTTNQSRIVDVIRHRLRPGGMAMVMYELATGWSAMVPIAESLRLHAEIDGRRGDLAFEDAARAVADLAEAGALYFPLAGPEATQMAQWPEAERPYAAHEYLGSHFNPLMVDSVASAMANARCSLVGGAGIIDHLSRHWTPVELADLIDPINDRILREMVRDVFSQRALRRDLYRRGTVQTAKATRDSWLESLVVVGSGKPLTNDPIELLTGVVDLDHAYHRALVDALTSEPLSPAKVTEIHPQWGLADASMALALLVAGGYALPATPTDLAQRATEACARLNRVLLDENLLGAAHSHLIAPVTGSAIECDLVEMLAIGITWNDGSAPPEAITDEVMRILARDHRTVRENRVLIHDPDKARTIVDGRVTTALTKLTTVLPSLGIR